MADYRTMVTAMKNLTQTTGTGNNAVTVKLPMAEDEWDMRPDTESYGMVSMDLEGNQLNGDNMKVDRSYEGSVDLFSHVKSGAGWVDLIEGTLAAYCGPGWGLNSHQYERGTGLTHWEWTFRIAG